MEEIVRISNFKHVYPDGTTIDLGAADLIVGRGERVALLGPNGSGKSTLLYHMLGLLKPTEGIVRVFGRDPARDYESIREKIGALLQNAEEQIIEPVVRDDIAFAPRNYGHSPAQVRAMVHNIAVELEITHLLDKVPHYMSGGEKLKVALAGALVLHPQLLILDEPFESLDGGSKHDLVHTLNKLHAESGLAIIFTTHDVNLMPHLADRIYVLGRHGSITDYGTPQEVFSHPDILAAHHMEAPVLSSLFWELRRRGIDLPLTLTVEEAAEVLVRSIHGRSSAA